MDREISIREQREANRKKWFRFILYISMILTVFLLLSFVLNKPVKRNDVLISIATKESIKSTLNATGKIIPKYEQIITSPVQSKIEEILCPVGTMVDSGQSLLKLNKEEILSTLSTIQDEYELSRVNLEKQKLEMDERIFDLETRIKIKRLKNESLKSKYEESKRIFEIGGGTQEEVEAANTNFQIGVIELAQFENQYKNVIKTRKIRTRELELKVKIQKKAVNDFSRKVKLADVYSNRKGVVTWINDNIGAQVIDGELLAKVADLSSFNVEGRISDLYADKMFIGQEVEIKINNSRTTGTIININPSVANNVANFIVDFNNYDISVIRPQMTVDLYLVTNCKDSAIIVENGAAFKGTEMQNIFVIKNNKAYKRKVKVGLSNIDKVEIISGVDEGDEVIVSDMRKFDKRDVIKVK